MPCRPGRAAQRRRADDQDAVKGKLDWQGRRAAKGPPAPLKLEAMMSFTTAAGVVCPPWRANTIRPLMAAVKTVEAAAGMGRDERWPPRPLPSSNWRNRRGQGAGRYLPQRSAHQGAGQEAAKQANKATGHAAVLGAGIMGAASPTSLPAKVSRQ